MIRYNNKTKFTRDQCSKGGSTIRGGEFGEESRQRSLQDAKGCVLRHGMSYKASHAEGIPWVKRRALFGRVDQIEILLGDEVIKTCGETQLTGKWAFARGV